MVNNNLKNMFPRLCEIYGGEDVLIDAFRAFWAEAKRTAPRFAKPPKGHNVTIMRYLVPVLLENEYQHNLQPALFHLAAIEAGLEAVSKTGKHKSYRKKFSSETLADYECELHAIHAAWRVNMLYDVEYPTHAQGNSKDVDIAYQHEGKPIMYGEVKRLRLVAGEVVGKIVDELDRAAHELGYVYMLHSAVHIVSKADGDVLREMLEKCADILNHYMPLKNHFLDLASVPHTDWLPLGISPHQYGIANTCFGCSPNPGQIYWAKEHDLLVSENVEKQLATFTPRKNTLFPQMSVFTGKLAGGNLILMAGQAIPSTQQYHQVWHGPAVESSQQAWNQAYKSGDQARTIREGLQTLLGDVLLKFREDLLPATLTVYIEDHDRLEDAINSFTGTHVKSNILEKNGSSFESVKGGLFQNPGWERVCGVFIVTRPRYGFRTHACWVENKNAKATPSRQHIDLLLEELKREVKAPSSS